MSKIWKCWMLAVGLCLLPAAPLLADESGDANPIGLIEGWISQALEAMAGLVGLDSNSAAPTSTSQSPEDPEYGPGMEPSG